MATLRLLCLTLVLGALTACAGLVGGSPLVDEPLPEVDEPPREMEEPPLATIKGVEGLLTMFCWKSGCADWFGHPAPETLPRVTTPLQIGLPLPAAQLEVTAIGPGGFDAMEIPLEVTDLVVTDSLPAGTVAVKVGVFFEGGGDAFN